MGSLAISEIEAFLQQLGQRLDRPVTLYLLGGSALCFLGNARRTLDIDYTLTASAVPDKSFDVTVRGLADEMHLEIEAVSIEEFVPLPEGSEQRHRWLGRFGEVSVYVYDPYTIALSKLSRGFESDLQDVLFLLRQQIINLDSLTSYVEAALTQAWTYDIDPAEMRQYFEEVKRQLTK